MFATCKPLSVNDGTSFGPGCLTMRVAGLWVPAGDLLSMREVRLASPTARSIAGPAQDRRILSWNWTCWTFTEAPASGR